MVLQLRRLTVSNSKSKIVESALQAEDIHLGWENSYYTEDNERFYEESFDYIIRILSVPNGAMFLDVGSGSCAHSIRLAKRGFYVLATDFSNSILKKAEQQILSFHLQDKIKLQREDILSLPFEDQTFDYILCWGVLMHIPDIEIAISELVRVLKKGGKLIISEGNMTSLQSIALRALKLILRKEQANVIKSVAGIEYWTQNANGILLTRQANIQWLIQTFKNNGLTLKVHVSGQLTELYTRFSSGLIRNLIHRVNHIWFKFIKNPYFAFGNIIILEKISF